MRQGPVRKRDFSDIDNLDRATASFMQEQRKLLEKFKPARAPHHQGFDPKKIIAYSATGVTLAVIVGICVFAGINFGSRGSEIRQPPESSVETSVSDTTQTTTATGATEASTASSVTDLPASSSKPSVTQPTTTATTAAQIEAPGTGTTATTASTQQTSKTNTSVTAPSSGGAPATKPTTPKPESTQAPPPQTTPPAATKPPAVTTAPPVVTQPPQTTPPTQPPKKANLTVPDYNAAGWAPCKLEKFSGMTEQTVTIHISNTGSGDFSGKQQLSVKLSGAGKIAHAACTTGQTSGSMTYSGDLLYFTFSGSIPAGATVTVTMNIISSKPIWSTDI